jgi:outer membrane protein assembly factor BamB
MSQDFVTELRLQLREAALREQQREPAARRLIRVRRGVPGPGPLAAALAVALLALAVAVGALALRGEPEPTAPKVVRSFRVADGLTSMAQGFGAVWATDLSSGNVLRIDPKTRKVVARIPVAGGVASGPSRPTPSPQVIVATGSGAVWALAGDLESGGVKGAVQLLRIDPRRNRVVAGIPLTKPSGGTFSPRAVHIGDDSIWVIGTAGALQIDPASNTPERYVPTGDTAARGVLADGDALWLLDVDGRLRQIDARTGRTVRTTRMPVTTGTHLAGGTPGPLMLVDDQRLTAFDPTNSRVLWRTAFEGPLRFLEPGRDDALWAYLDRTPERRDRLVRIDAGTGRRTGQVDLRGAGAAGLAQVGRDLWIGGADGRITVVR